MIDTDQLTQLVIDTLDDHKGLAITELDITALTDIADRMIICTATSRRHGSALADKVVMKSKEHEVQPLGVEGLESAEWILIDLQDVIIHIMLQETRDFYSLEKLWQVVKDSRKQHKG